MNLNLDLDGAIDLQEELDDLQDEWDTDRVYSVGSNVEYGIYLEMGTEDMPPYPWFKPAIREFRANPETFILDNTGYSSIEEIPNSDQMVLAVANALENRMKDNVSAQTATNRSPGTDSEHPSRETGNLAASISAERIR